MISTPDRQTAIALINEAITAGARRAKACAALEISDRTLRRWTKGGQVRPDQRPLVPRPEPANKLSEAERAAVLEACNSKEFSSLPPSQIVPNLADQGLYLASESSFYRILRADGQQHHRGRAKPAVRRKPPTSYQACAPCQVWTWDITWMPGPVSGMFFYLYLIVDIFSRKIVGWEVHERESADLAAALIRQAVLAEGCIARPLVLHADNGSPMKGATMKVTMEKLGITASYSRPRVSNDNPFSEALFRTCKYRPDWPTKGFATKADAQAWVKSFASWYKPRPPDLTQGDSHERRDLQWHQGKGGFDGSKDYAQRQVRRRASPGNAVPGWESGRRMLAIALVLDGVDRKTAAENCGMVRQTLRDWAHRYNAGRVGLRIHPVC